MQKIYFLALLEFFFYNRFSWIPWKPVLRDWLVTLNKTILILTECLRWTLKPQSFLWGKLLCLPGNFSPEQNNNKSQWSYSDFYLQIKHNFSICSIFLYIFYSCGEFGCRSDILYVKIQIWGITLVNSLLLVVIISSLNVTQWICLHKLWKAEQWSN